MKTIRNITIVLGLLCATIYHGECQNVTLSSPKPVFPAQNQQLNPSYPTFSWMPSFPSDGTLTYNFILVEVLEGQKPLAAISSNPPVLSKRSIRGNSLNYPIAAPPLSRNKEYAWQVSTNYHLTVDETRQSGTLPGEVFGFSMMPVDPNACINLLAVSEESNKVYEISHGELRFTMASNDGPSLSNMTFSIVDQSGKPVTKSKIRPVNDGGNPVQYLIYLRKYASFRSKKTKNRVYTLIGTTPEQVTYRVKFSMKNTKS